MTDIAVTAARVSRVDPENDRVEHGILASTTTAGQLLYQDTDGEWEIADGSATGTAQVRGMALEGGGAGQGVTILRSGLVAGFTLTQAYDARLYLSDTAGTMADAAGSVSVVVGRVHAMSDADKTKVVDFCGGDMREQYT